MVKELEYGKGTSEFRRPESEASAEKLQNLEYRDNVPTQHARSHLWRPKDVPRRPQRDTVITLE